MEKTSAEQLLSRLFHVTVEVSNTDAVLEFIIKVPIDLAHLNPDGTNYPDGLYKIVKNYLDWTLQFNDEAHSHYEITELCPVEEMY